MAWLLLAGLAAGASALTVKAGDVAEGPVAKVVSLLEQMREQVQKDDESDQAAAEKHQCWCDTNRAQKTATVKRAEVKITQLSSFIEEAAGTKARLESEVTALERAIAANQEALRTASALREQENAEFLVTQEDSKETHGLLGEAIGVLSQANLLQSPAGTPTKGRSALLQQARNAIRRGIEAGTRRGHVAFHEVMQQDLWDAMASLEQARKVGQEGNPSEAFLSPRPNRQRRMSAIERQGAMQPGGLSGHAAGTKSYDSASGGVVGILQEMNDQVERDLQEKQKMSLEATVAYHRLRSAKEAEVSAATGSKTAKSASLADIVSQAAKSKEDLASTSDALSADQKFMVGLEDSCKSNEEGHVERSKSRKEELVAISQAIAILSEDDSRDLFGKTVSFFQGAKAANVGADRDHGAARTFASRSAAAEQAMRKIMRVSTKTDNWALASLAVRVRLDDFTRVKETMDRMTTDLKKQRIGESKKVDFCKHEIHQTEDDSARKNSEKGDLEGKRLGLENGMSVLKDELAALGDDISSLHVGLKRAGEDRMAENKLFQQSVGDQRATVNVLRKASAKLQAVYAAGSLVQQPAAVGNEPGKAIAPPPPPAAEYARNGGGGGVLALLAKIEQDVAKDEMELIATEQSAQSAYESLTKDTNAALDASNKAVLEKTQLSEEAASDKSEAEAGLLSVGQELEKLADTLKAMHLDCDFLLQHFDTRQTAIQEELDAIAEAKAILSGADYGVDNK